MRRRQMPHPLSHPGGPITGFFFFFLSWLSQRMCRGASFCVLGDGVWLPGPLPHFQSGCLFHRDTSVPRVFQVQVLRYLTTVT